MNTVLFEKYQGLGNDFILIDLAANPVVSIPQPDTMRRLCHRHFGVGSDGILLFSTTSDRVVRMVYYNADGSRAETCFNGLRCIALHAVRTGLFKSGDEFTITTDADEVLARVEPDGNLVRLDIKGPSFKPSDAPITADHPVIDRELEFAGDKLVGTALSFGNPHFVAWVSEDDLDKLNQDVSRLGDAVVNSPLFPHGTNFELAAYNGGDEVLMAVWERGVGVTMACGSGATATVCAGVAAGRLPTEQPVKVKMAGGTLTITVHPDLARVTVVGEAAHVFSGSIDLSDLQS